jgi:hypothetical protein
MPVVEVVMAAMEEATEEVVAAAAAAVEEAVQHVLQSGVSAVVPDGLVLLAARLERARPRTSGTRSVSLENLPTGLDHQRGTR